MNSFREILQEWPPERVRRLIERNSQPEQVERALSLPEADDNGLAALLSPAASGMLEPIAQRAVLLTRRRFGHTMQFYTPLYVSNYCRNACVYCGFSCRNKVRRRTLSLDEAEAESDLLAAQGFQHILLVSGEDREAVPITYFEQLAGRLRSKFASVAIEIYPLAEEEYSRLARAGVDSLTLYQETYQPEEYKKFHPAGPKRDFDYRLEAVERAARGGITFLGIGSLLGLADWRLEGFYTGLHAKWLARKFWRSHVSISFPRLQHASGDFQPPVPAGEAELTQLITALRLYFPEAGLVLSTRENPRLREHLIPLGITRISAGSRTSPGGYSEEEQSEPQFAVQDTRSLREMEKLVVRLGFEPVRKDWDPAYH